MNSPADNPYVGPRAFTFAERNRFFGREREARELQSRVIAERLVLFYAQSGAGKTSLINTSLIPQLKDKSVGYTVLPVSRVSGDVPQSVQDVANIFIFNLLLHLDQSNGDPGRFVTMSLKDFLVGLSSEDGEHYYYDATIALEADSGEYATPVHVLIIDQFEEIFVTHLERWQDREDFFRQLDEAMAADPQLWVVLSLREDYVAALDPYASLLANRMRARFYMQRMGYEVALEAVRRPAQQYDRPFAPGVAERLVDNLRQIRMQGETVTRLGEFVEPVQLQVVCYQLWEKLKDREAGAITAQDVQQLGDVDTALADFYEQVIARTVQAGVVVEAELREWFSQELITEARTRGTVYVGTTQAAGLPNEAVKSLTEQYLLRGEMRAGGVWVELVHDRFVEPILRANESWLSRQSRLVQDAMAWEQEGKDDNKLYVGQALQEALAGVGQERQESVVSRFLDASQAKNEALVERETARQRELEATRQLAEERARTATVLRRRAWVLLGASVMAVLCMIIALIYYWYADSARKNARKNELSLRAEVARQQNERSNFTQGLLVSLGVLEVSKAEFGEPLAAAESQLYRAVWNLRERLILTGHKNNITHAVLSLNGKRLATASADNTVRLWDTESGKLVAELVGFKKAVVAVAFSRDGTRLATASADNTVQLWDTESGRRVTKLDYQEAVVAVAFNHDGTCLATASEDNTARLWDTASGGQVAKLTGHTKGVIDVAFNPDGTRLATASADNTARLWDTASGGQVAKLTGHTKGVIDVAFNPDGTRLATASDDNTARIWDDSGTLVHKLSGHRRPLVHVAFSPDGTRLATASADNTARLWDTASGQLSATLTGHLGQVVHVAFSLDGTHLATASQDRTTRLWDTASGRLSAALTGHEYAVLDSAFSPDGTWLASASSDKTARLWNTSNQSLIPLTGHTDRVVAVAFSPNGTRLATASADNTARLWDTASGELVAELTGHKDRVTAVAFSPDGTRLATASADNTARLWDIASGGQVAKLTGHTKSVIDVAFNSDGTRLATASWDNTARIWDTASGERVAEFPGHKDRLTAVAFSPDGTRLATASLDNTARLWDTKSGQPATLTGHDRGVVDVAFSPDGTRLATASWDNTARLWDTKSGQPVATLIGHENDIFKLAFSPDGTRLATASLDNTARIWDARGKQVATLTGHQQPVVAVAFNHDGTRLATASADNTARLWNTASGQLVAELTGHEDRVTAVAFSPDGTHLATASGDTTARLWRIFSSTQQLIAHAQTIKPRVSDGYTVKPRELTFDECKQYSLPMTALALSQQGEELARQGKLPAALDAYQKAVQRDPMQISALSWGQLCWQGSIRGYAAKVVDKACREAVSLAPDNGMIVDSRGLARALTGDLQGAIEDFQFRVDWSTNKGYAAGVTKRKEWINKLEAIKKTEKKGSEANKSVYEVFKKEIPLKY